jgi:hypothetical protein
MKAHINNEESRCRASFTVNCELGTIVKMIISLEGINTELTNVAVDSRAN